MASSRSRAYFGCVELWGDGQSVVSKIGELDCVWLGDEARLFRRG